MLNNLISISSKFTNRVKSSIRIAKNSDSANAKPADEESLNANDYVTPIDAKDIQKQLNRTIIHELVKEDKNIISSGILDSVIEMVESALNFESLDLIYCEMANFILNIGQPKTALKYYKLSLAHNHLPSTYSLYLQCLLMCPSIDEQSLFGEAFKYNEFFADVKPYKIVPKDLRANKVLKVGYICHFFSNSVSDSLLLPFLREHDKQQIQVYCYSDTAENEVPSNVEMIADVWRNTKHLNCASLAQIIKEDEIDILLELNGHCVVNRYDVLARKPAPIQINYYNQAGTTGMDTIDYILIGDHITLPEAAAHYSETPYFLKGISGIAIFPTSFPEVSPAPFLHNNFITFGSFGAAHKVNKDVIHMWCNVLKSVPDARFFMKAGVLTHKPFLDAYKKLFLSEGIDLERIKFEGMSEHLKMLECYSQVDIALDTYPHAGGTTTMEAIWQGVPVVTYSSDRYSSQNGKVVNTCIGHPELISYSEDEFIHKAVELANDKDRILLYRNNLRNDFKNSSLYDANRHARRLENAYRDMWLRYLSTM